MEATLGAVVRYGGQAREYRRPEHDAHESDDKDQAHADYPQEVLNGRAHRCLRVTRIA